MPIYRIMFLAALFSGLTFISPFVKASVEWQTFSFSYLHGDHYRVGNPDRQIITFEHAATTSWGDSFLFWDHSRFNNGEHTDYAEWSPRISLCQTGIYCPTDTTLVKDWLFSSTVEIGEDFINGLYGVGLQLNIPGLRYFNINLYRRDNEEVADNWQTTLTWGLSFRLGNQNFLFDGFLDWASTSEDQRSNMNWTSQVKWNLGENWGSTSPIYLGVEYVYWTNKYGIKDSPAFRTDESNLNLLIKMHF